MGKTYFKLHEIGNNYSLLLTDFHPADKVFNDAGHEGGGYDWASVLKYYVNKNHPDWIGRFGFDPEASMFCAYGNDAKVLEQLGEIGNRLMIDAKELTAIIKEVPSGEWE